MDNQYTSEPPDSESIGLGASRMREDRAAIVDVLAAEHVILDTGESAAEFGRHRPGSGIVFIAETAPTLRPNGDPLTEDDVGRLWLKPDAASTTGGYELYVYVKTVDNVAPTPDVFDWVCIFRFKDRVDQDLRKAADVEFASVTAGAGTFDSLALDNGTTAEITVRTTEGVRHAAVASPQPGDIWIAP